MLTSIFRQFSVWKDFVVFQKLGYPPARKEQISKSQLRKYLPGNPLMIDCGAHDGADTVELVRVLGGTIHAFEPVPLIFQRLKQRAASRSNIHCYQLALSNKNGEETFFVSEGASDASSSLLPPKDHLKDHKDVTFSQKISVRTMTLDAWAQANGIDHVDLLWLDMQGFEKAMLQASDNIFKTVKVIHTEVSTKETYAGVPLYEEYAAFLRSQGFKVVLEAIPEGWDMGNVLFVRE